MGLRADACGVWDKVCGGVTRRVMFGPFGNVRGAWDKASVRMCGDEGRQNV